MLLRAYELVKRDIEHMAPGGLVFGRVASDVAGVRAALLRILGQPPLLLGEERQLPWSLRAGGATMAFHAGMDPVRIMRLGRWDSEVAIMYSVLGARVQVDTWLAAFRDSWYPARQDAD